jgi:dTMP kinase
VKPFIVFEGIDGAGTTTHSKALVERLTERGVQAVWTCEPTKTPIGTFIREVFERKHGDQLPTWRTMTLLFQADREQHCHEIEKLRETHVVVCDRFMLSTLVYQPLQGLIETGRMTYENIDEMLKSREIQSRIDWVSSLNEHLLKSWPTETFLLDVSVEEAIRRKGEKKTDLFEHRLMWEASRRQYLLAEFTVEGNSMQLINTEQPKEEVVQLIDERVSELGI